MTERYVTARLPERYGRVGVRGRDGREVDHAGGSVVEMPEQQARDLGAEPVEAKPSRASVRHDVPPGDAKGK